MYTLVATVYTYTLVATVYMYTLVATVYTYTLVATVYTYTLVKCFTGEGEDYFEQGKTAIDVPSKQKQLVPEIVPASCKSQVKINCQCFPISFCLNKINSITRAIGRLSVR